MKKPAIALMCKSHDYKMKSMAITNLCITSAWTMSKEKASSLIGENVVLTESRKDPAYMGGKITAVTPIVNDTTRYDVWFEPDTTMKGNTDAVGHPGWGSGRAVCYL